MKKALLVVDMQQDFISGALGTPEAEEIVQEAAERIRQAREEGNVWIAYTMDTHGAEYMQTQEGQRLPVAHCLLGSPGWQLHPDIAAVLPEGAMEFQKSTFGSQALAAQLPEDIEEVELLGVCTDICVISNAMLLKAARPEVRIVINAACCAGVTPQSHETALRAMQGCQIDII